MRRVSSELINRLKPAGVRCHAFAAGQRHVGGEPGDGRPLAAIRSLGLKPDISRVLPQPG